MNNWMWLAVAGSLIGTVGVNYRRPWGQALWTVCNVAWTVYHWRCETYPAAALFAVYAALSFWGFMKWRRVNDRD